MIAEADRAAMLAALACVHHVVVFDDDTPHALLQAIRPDVLVKGGTYTADEIVGHEIVEAYGGAVCVTGVVDGISTTNILASLARGETTRQPRRAPNRRPACAERVESNRRDADCSEHRLERTMKQKLTVIIPCKNERKNIRPCIESAKRVADEVLVADSGSTDGTLDIVRSTRRLPDRRARIHQLRQLQELGHSAGQPPLGPDRRCRRARDRGTGRGNQRAAGRRAAHDGYHIYRANYFLGHRIRHGGWGRDKVLRLFRRDLGRYVGESDHAEVSVASGNVGHLKARLEHFTYWTYDQYFRKFHRYTVQGADNQHAAGRRASFVRMLLSPPLRFLHCYIVRLGFLDGMAGLQISALTGMSSFVKQIRLWELEHARAAARSGGRHAPPGQTAERQAA